MPRGRASTPCFFSSCTHYVGCCERRSSLASQSTDLAQFWHDRDCKDADIPRPQVSELLSLMLGPWVVVANATLQLYQSHKNRCTGYQHAVQTI